MQAELDNLKLIAVLGIIHDAVEVLERSAIVFIDHICHVILILNNGWYRYYKHVVWINCYYVC